MPSQLVGSIRGLIKDRVEFGRPITDLERAMIVSAVAHRVQGGRDVVDELEAAIAQARRILLGRPTGTATAGPVDYLTPEQRRAVGDLLAAARAVIDYEPAPLPDPDVDPRPVVDVDLPPPRADVDG